MNKSIIRRVSVAFLVGASLIACDDSSDSSADAASDGSTPSDAGADAGAVDAAATKDAATSSDAAVDAAADAAVDAGAQDAGPALACADYCTTIMANCTGNKAQYPSMDSCVRACAGFPVGLAADTSGNTLGCRTYHAGAAAADSMTHCQHAGPSGAGSCGTLCEGFCAIQATACTGANMQFASAAACATACGTFAHGTAPYNTSFTSGNTDFCRVYHLSVAASSAANATTHCPHIVVSSPTCN